MHFSLKGATRERLVVGAAGCGDYYRVIVANHRDVLRFGRPILGLSALLQRHCFRLELSAESTCRVHDSGVADGGGHWHGWRVPLRCLVDPLESDLVQHGLVLVAIDLVVELCD